MAAAQSAVAQVAYTASTSIYIIEESAKTTPHQPILTREVTHLQSQSIKNIFNESTNLTILPANTDPFSKLLGGQATANGGALISVLVSSKSLIPAIPHLYKIANGSEGGGAKFPAVVIHAAVDCNPENNLGDYADIMAIRQTGFAILQSTGGQEALDVALIAHALAIKTGVPVLHFFDASSTITSVTGSRETPKYFGNDAIAKFVQESGIAKHHENYQETTKDQQNELYFRPVKGNNKEENSEFFFTQAQEIFAQFKKIVGRSYGIVEFSGDNEAESLIITLGSGSTLIQRVFRRHPRPKVATIKVRLYRPWSDKHLLTIIPKSIKKVVVLEQVSTKRATTKWTPLYLDVTAAFQNREYWSGEAPFMVGGQYGALSDDESVDAAVAEVFVNLASGEPQREFIFGKSRSQNGPQGSNGIVATVNEQPALEKQYVKILEEVFGGRLFIANAISQPTIGYHHLEAAAVKSTPEFGFGVLLAKLQERARFTDLVSQVVRDSSIKMPDPLHDTLSQWHSNKNDATLASKHGDSAVKSLAEIHASHPLLNDIYARKDQFQKQANWLIGSDVWAYDVGNSGVHHVISSGKDINLLIIDSQPYTTRTAADPEKRKKDIGLYAMNYGDVYVASIAVYSSFTQVLHAFIEAEKFPGPSIVLAYLPYHTENDTTITVLKETKLAVDAGYWPLYRWNPELEKQGQEPFTLDSERIKQELQAFLDRENHLTQVVQARPELASNLVSSLESEIATRQKSIAESAYEKLLGGLTGPPLLILFGSDNGNAEGLARTLQKGAVARGVNARCMAMDEYPIEELGTEKNLVIVCCTAGQGEFPQNGREFWKTISSTTDISLAETQYTVFGLGDSHYWPRPEDAIYYNKPGKELDARLELLGGKRLLRLGLGDDQDPDGYETAFQAWEPELWGELGVELLGTAVVEPKKTDDDMKVESNYLRGTIAEGLEDTSTGALTERDTKLTKFHGIYQQDDRDLREERKAQGMEKAFMFMVRVRVPGGVSTPQQWLAMDEISDSYANGSIKLTTRQAFQLHGVVKRNLKSTIRNINKCLLDTLAACGDVNRNVMCNPNPYLSEVHDQVYEFSKQLSAHLSPQTTAYHEIWLEDKMVAGRAVQDYEPLYGPTYLPRKFKIAVAVPPNNDVDVFAHDLGFIAIADQNGKLAGYNVTVGGGMGMTHNNKKTYPRLGDIIGFCTPEQGVDVGEKVMLVQRDFGDRTNRKHARLKYTIDDRSVEWFKEELETRLGYKLQPERAYTFDSNADRYGWTKGVNNRWHFCMYIENGRVVDLPGAHIKTGLREIAKIHKGDFRLTPNQHLVLGSIPEEDKPRIEELLKKYGLDNLKYTGLRLNSMACVALPTCGLAMAESERYLPTLVSKLEEVVEEVGLSHDAITIRMTGCPNGCARPYVAEIAFVGKAPGTYNVYLGGGFYGQRLNKLYKESLKEDDIMRELRSILTRYVKEREDGERFGDFAIRTGYVKATTAGKNFHE